MIRNTLLIFFLTGSMLGFSQTSTHIIADSADYFLQKGLQEKKEGRKLASLHNLEKAFKHDSTDKIILAELAAAYHDVKRYRHAIDTYKKLNEAGDVSANTYKQLLTLSFNFRQYDDVILYAGKLKQADPSEKINYYVGRAYYEQENYGEAIKYLDAAAKEDPNNAEVPYLIAHSYTDMDNYRQSIPYFQKAIEMDTTKSYWMYELSLVYYSLNDNKNSLKYILMAGEKGYKKDNDYMENLGVAYLNAGKVDEAINILSELLKKKPADADLLNMLAEIYYNRKKYQNAIDYWDQILYYDKQNASALYMIGMSYQKMGETEKGMKLCDKAIEMDPSLGTLKQKQMMMGM